MSGRVEPLHDPREDAMIRLQLQCALESLRAAIHQAEQAGYGDHILDGGFRPAEAALVWTLKELS